MNFLFVAIGAFFGSMLRYFISVKLNKRLIGTWIANISGSILLGLVVNYHLNGLIANWLWMLLGTGFCGAYTTFSTFGNETLNLVMDRKFGKAVGYVAGSLGISFIFIYLFMVNIF